jgi:hypothetical protein
VWAVQFARDDFQEAAHPRGEAGTSKGGQFVKKGEGGGSSVKPKAAAGSTVVNPVAKVLKAHGYTKQKQSNTFKHPSGHEIDVHAAHEGQKWLTGFTHEKGNKTGSGAGALHKYLTKLHGQPAEPVKEALKEPEPKPELGQLGYVGLVNHASEKGIAKLNGPNWQLPNGGHVHIESVPKETWTYNSPDGTSGTYNGVGFKALASLFTKYAAPSVKNTSTGVHPSQIVHNYLTGLNFKPFSDQGNVVTYKQDHGGSFIDVEKNIPLAGLPEWTYYPGDGSTISGKGFSNQKLKNEVAKHEQPAASPTKTETQISVPPELVTNTESHPVSFGTKTEPGEVHTLADKKILYVGKETGKWQINSSDPAAWKSGNPVLAEGQGQKALNEAFEKLHPRGEGGKFAAKPGGTEPLHPSAIVSKVLDQNGFKPTKQLQESTKYEDPTGNILYVSKKLGIGGGDYSWVYQSSTGITHKSGNNLNSLKEYLNTLASVGKVELPPQKKAIGETLNQSDLTKVGKQLGSNPGGTYEDKDGNKYYLKEPKSVDHSRNELLAAALMRAAGGNTLDYHPVVDGDKLNIATKLVPLEASNVNQLEGYQRLAAKNDFALQAWIGNWDATGIDGSNIGVVGGKVTNLDLGGSLRYRAQGGTKQLLQDASEWETLRDPAKNAAAAGLYGDMTPAQLSASANRLKLVSNDTIRDLVQEWGPSNSDDKYALQQTLINRRDAILKKASQSTAVPAAPAVPKPLHTSSQTWNDTYKKRIKETPLPANQGEADAIKTYSGGAYDSWNKALRQSFGYDSGGYDKATKDLRNYLSRASLPEEITVSRRVSGNFAKHLLQEAQDKEHTFQDHGFASTDDWSGELKIVLTLPKGAQAAAIGQYSLHPSENEILVQAGSKYRATKYDTNSHTLYATLIRSGPAGTGVWHE